jgi:hypothetical protein
VSGARKPPAGWRSGVIGGAGLGRRGMVLAVIVGLTCLVTAVVPAAGAATGSAAALVAWGDMSAQQQGVLTGLSDVTLISAAGDQGLALKSDGTVVPGANPAPARAGCRPGWTR